MAEDIKPGPYNYCDYRCDRCDERKDCAVYKEDQERLLDHYLKGEDPQDTEVLVKDLKEIFKKTERMIREWAEKEGIDIDELSDGEDISRVDPNEFVIYRLAHEYSIEAHKFLKEIEEKGMPASVEEEYEDLIWYHSLIFAKTGRLVSEPMDELDDKWKIEEEQGTLGVINKGIRISKKALNKMINEMPDHLHVIAHLTKLLKEIENQIQTDLYQRI